MSWKPEVIADNSGKWVSNMLRFATREEAEQYVYDLAMRWTAVRDTRVVECDEPVEYTYHDRQLRPTERIVVTATRSNEVDPDQQELPL